MTSNLSKWLLKTPEDSYLCVLKSGLWALKNYLRCLNSSNHPETLSLSHLILLSGMTVEPQGETRIKWKKVDGKQMLREGETRRDIKDGACGTNTAGGELQVKRQAKLFIISYIMCPGSAPFLRISSSLTPTQVFKEGLVPGAREPQSASHCFYKAHQWKVGRMMCFQLSLAERDRASGVRTLPSGGKCVTLHRGP